MTGKYTLEPVDDWDLWDRCVNASPQGSIFLLSNYLKFADVPSRFWFIRKGSAIRGGLCVQETQDGSECRLDDLVIHNGLWFLSDSTKKYTRARNERFEITEVVIDLLVKRYSTVELALTPQLEDLRPFLWHNYDSSAGSKFEWSLRYTSYLDIDDLATPRSVQEDYSVFARLGTVRQRNLREAWKTEAQCSSTGDPDVLLDNYQRMMGLTEEGFAIKRRRMKLLMEGLINNSMGCLYEACDEDGNICYSTFFGWDKHRAYYLFGSGATDSKEKYHGTFAFWEALLDLSQCHGISEVDWEGVNSPLRGSFKLSFGGELLPYYNLKWSS
jgi:hypothetical protein|tara:strand:+ start:182 stop:1165 length:984 start_codon:yes stop_codon:yes gene_type:complete